jgi:hypothetical protein
MRFHVTLLSALLASLTPCYALAQTLEGTTYSVGTPELNQVWVDPVKGNDNNRGSSRTDALLTVTEAWDRIPEGVPLTGKGYQINLVAGTYTASHLPNFWQLRFGSQEAPIIIKAIDGKGTAIITDSVHVTQSQYVYFLGVDIELAYGDQYGFQCKDCDHVLLRNMEVKGAAEGAENGIDIVRSSNVYLENNEISRADRGVTFTAVQSGHVMRSNVHDTAMWGIGSKGGSAYVRIEGNQIRNSPKGIVAGGESGLDELTTPWVHYEAYDHKIINNTISHVEDAGFSVKGGYNILFAHNTLYETGSKAPALEFGHGLRKCRTAAATCVTSLNQGAWGSPTEGQSESIPNRNVYVMNNVVYHPSQQAQSHSRLSVASARAGGAASNLPSVVSADQNLRIEGNVFWEGNNQMALGAGESGEGCGSGNATCNPTQILATNRIGTLEPLLQAPVSGDLRPVDATNLVTFTVSPVPAFPGDDRVATPLAPVGTLTNVVQGDIGGGTRAETLPGAYSGPNASLSIPDAPDAGAAAPTPTPIPTVAPTAQPTAAPTTAPAKPTVAPTPTRRGDSGRDAPPKIVRALCAPAKIRAGKKVTCNAAVTDDRGVTKVRVVVDKSTVATLKRVGSHWLGKWTAPKKVAKGTHPVSIVATDTKGQETSKKVGQITG